MALIEWKDEFSVGVTQIDEQHKRLIDLINELHDAMIQRKSKETLSPTLNTLYDYTATHFRTEEKFFDQIKYVDSDAHKTEHAEFVRKVGEFKSGFDAGKLFVSIDVMNFLRDWLKNHILGSDRKYAPAFKEHGIS